EMPPPVRELRPDVPGRLDELVMKCLSKSPAGRPASAQVVADELRRIRATLSKTGSRVVKSDLPVLVLGAEETGKPLRLSGAVTVIGRSSDCDLILKVADVSKHHCRIVLKPGHAFVEDLNSANGTHVNGQPVETCELHDGDVLEIADHVFR